MGEESKGVRWQVHQQVSEKGTLYFVMDTTQKNPQGDMDNCPNAEYANRLCKVRNECLPGVNNQKN